MWCTKYYCDRLIFHGVIQKQKGNTLGTHCICHSVADERLDIITASEISRCVWLLRVFWSMDVSIQWRCLSTAATCVSLFSSVYTHNYAHFSASISGSGGVLHHEICMTRSAYKPRRFSHVTFTLTRNSPSLRVWGLFNRTQTVTYMFF